MACRAAGVGMSLWLWKGGGGSLGCLYGGGFPRAQRNLGVHVGTNVCFRPAGSLVAVSEVWSGQVVPSVLGGDFS